MNLTSEFCCSNGPQRENERKLKKKKKTVEDEDDGDTNYLVGTVPTNLVKRLEKLKLRGRIETTQTITLFRLARIHRRVLKT